MATEKHHYIAQEKLRDKYLGPANFPKVKSLVKAIQQSSGARIEATLKKNNTVQFVITGQGHTVEKARKSVVYEFEKSAGTSVPRVRRAELVFLEESDHKRLQEEIPEDTKNPILLTEDALRKFDILTGASELRQFACGRCKRPWWTYVPRTKPVSSCIKCHVKYDALDRSKEFGLGRYICLPCDNTFYARCEATEQHICLHCDKLTGPPYISPRFKPLRRGTRGPPPHRVHKVFNESTVHDSTGSTIATFLTEDLGQDIYVPVVLAHFWSRQDYTKRFEDDPETSAPDRPLRFEEARKEDEDEFQDRPPTPETVVDWEMLSGIESHPTSTDSESEEVSRKRAQASDSEDSSPDDDNADSRSEDSGPDDDYIDKLSVTSVVSSLEESEPDSGLGTWSKGGSGSSVSGATSGSSSARPPVSSLICDFSNVAEYPGIAFSKQKFEKKMTKKGGVIIGEGAKLSVPPGAIPVDDEVTVSLQACVGGPFSLPLNDSEDIFSLPLDDSEDIFSLFHPQDDSDKELVFISPVYLVQPPFAFRENVTLSIHTFVEYDADYDFDDFCFVTSPTQKVLNEKDEPHWVFKKFGFPVFDEEHRDGGHRMRGLVRLKHFCFCGFAGIGRRKKFSYCYCLHKPLLLHPPITYALFSVSIHHEAYIENLDRYIKAHPHIRNQDLASQSRIITFTADGVVKLKLPVDTALEQGYSLSSDTDPCEILKEDVDYPLKNKKRAVKDYTLYPPKIELQIMDKKHLTTQLEFCFKVEGIKQNISPKFLLTHSPADVSSCSSGAERSSSISGENSASSTPRSSTGGISSEGNSTASTPKSSAAASGGENTVSSKKRRSKSSTAGAERSPVASNGACGMPADIVRSSSHSSESGSSGVFSSEYGSQDSQEGSTASPLDSEPVMSELYNYLIQLSSKWEDIAFNLDLEEEICSIDQDGRNVESKLRKVLSKWKAQRPKPYTWRTIIKALREHSLKENRLAEKIERERYTL